MIKTIDVLTESIKNAKNSFRKVENRPKKAQKHRYERRKVNEFIRVGGWAAEEQV